MAGSGTARILFGRSVRPVVGWDWTVAAAGLSRGWVPDRDRLGQHDLVARPATRHRHSRAGGRTFSGIPDAAARARPPAWRRADMDRTIDAPRVCLRPHPDRRPPTMVDSPSPRRTDPARDFIIGPEDARRDVLWYETYDDHVPFELRAILRRALDRAARSHTGRIGLRVLPDRTTPAPSYWPTQPSLPDGRGRRPGCTVR